MASNELAIRFTEETYATKNEVSKELKMSLIDNIWSNILNYRSNFNRYLPIRSINKSQMLICFCPSINSALSKLESKLLKSLKEYMRLDSVSGDLSYFESTCLISSLKSLVKEYDLDADELYLKSLVKGDLKEVSAQNRILYRYKKSLDFIKKSAYKNIDIDFLAQLYSVFTENNELTTFYRTTEDSNPENRVLIDRIYTCAPTSLIDNMMNSLFDFIEQSNLNGLTKAIVTYYYVNYIRPFPQYSDDIALLLAKAILAHYDFDSLGVLIPLEDILVENAEQIARVFVEVQKTNDLTYFINYAISFINNKCEFMSDIIANRSVYELRNDFYKVDDEEIKEEVVEETPVEVKEIAPVAEVKEEVLPTPTVIEIKKEEVNQTQEIAVSYIPPALDEKQAARLEQHLLELEPTMKKGEAKFFARHCTMGKRYTIAQYKKALGCAYETARTSMDHLVELGYYRKEAVKNKHVYTPLKQG